MTELNVFVEEDGTGLEIAENEYATCLVGTLLQRLLIALKKKSSFCYRRYSVRIDLILFLLQVGCAYRPRGSYRSDARVTRAVQRRKGNSVLECRTESGVASSVKSAPAGDDRRGGTVCESP